MLTSNHTLAKRRVRSAVKVTRKAINRALDAAEPRLEAAASEISDLGRDAVKSVQKGTRRSLADLRSNYGRLERKIRRRPARSVTAGKAALVAAGVAAIAIGLLRKH